MQGIHRKERENRKSKQKKRKTHLTHTGLLMEGVSLPTTVLFIADRCVLVMQPVPSELRTD
jgi:hypothetical protein